MSRFVWAAGDGGEEIDEGEDGEDGLRRAAAVGDGRSGWRGRGASSANNGPIIMCGTLVQNNINKIDLIPSRTV
jgi:hypothetical protein